jgi:hypothetical protein
MFLIPVGFDQRALLFENLLNHRDGNLLEMYFLFSHRSFSLDTPSQPSSDTGKIFNNSANGGNGPFSGTLVARGVTNALTPLLDRNAKGWLSFANLVVLYSQNAYDCASVVIRLAQLRRFS